MRRSAPAESSRNEGAAESEAAEAAESDQAGALRPVDPQTAAQRREELREANAEAMAAGAQAPEAGSLNFREVGDGDARPVVILLHGYGARGDDLLPLAYRLHGGQRARYVLPAAPIEMPHGGRRWFGRRAEGIDEGERTRARAAIETVISGLVADGVAREQIILGGFSQGAMLSLDVALHGPRLGGLLLLSGSTLSNAPLNVAVPGALDAVPVLVAHGRADRVLSFQIAESMSERLRELGADVTWQAFDGGHETPRDNRAILGTIGRVRALAVPAAAE